MNPENDDDRARQGTKAERKNKLPLGVRIRYGIAIVVSTIAAYGAFQAHQTSQQNGHDEQRLAVTQRGLVSAQRTLAATQALLLSTQHTLATSEKQSTQTRVVTVKQRCHLTKLITGVLVHHDLGDARPFQTSLRGCLVQLKQVEHIDAQTPAVK